MRVNIASVLVQDQATARDFYTGILGFQIKEDVPMGEFHWLTLVSPQDPEGVELLLEATAFPPSQVYQRALFDAGIPLTAFTTDDIGAEYARLKDLGVVFTGEPSEPYPGGPMMGIFEDTCGNRIALVQAH